MILFFANLLTRFFGIDLQKAQRAVIIAGIVLLGVFVLVFGLWMRSCFKKTPKLDEAEIQRGEQAVKDGNDKELKEIIVNSVAQEKIADAVAANGTADKDAIVKETQQTWGNANRNELQAEFDKRRGQ